MVSISTVCISCFVLGILSLLELLLHDKIKYSKLVNPLVILLPFYLALTIIARVGVYTPMEPSWAKNAKISFTSVAGAVGFLPELMLLLELIVSALVDVLFWRCVERRMGRWVGEEGSQVALQGQASEEVVGGR